MFNLYIIFILFTTIILTKKNIIFIPFLILKSQDLFYFNLKFTPIIYKRNN